MISRAATLVVIAVALMSARSVDAQQFRMRFQNTMQTTADVILRPLDGGQPVEFAIGNGNTVNLLLQSDRFDVQVIPRDEADSGFRMNGIDFRAEARQLNGRPFVLDGEFARGPLTRYRSWCGCYFYAASRGERIAVNLSGVRTNGTRFFVRSKKEIYPFE